MSCLTTLGVDMQAVEVDAQRHQHTQANLDEIRWFEAYCQLPLCDVKKDVKHWWALAAMRAAWVAGSLKSGALHHEVGRRWDLCSWIYPTLDTRIALYSVMSSIEPRLIWGGCLGWHLPECILSRRKFQLGGYIGIGIDKPAVTRDRKVIGI